MNNIDITKQQAGKFLGQQMNEYKTSYDKSLLVPVERKYNRIDYNIDDNNLSFDGIDTWNIYEVSFLTENGLPITGVGKLTYSSSSKCIVESKSLKLYFFSFNMMKYGSSVSDSIDIVEKTVINDLSELLGVNVQFKIHVDSENNNPVPLFDTYSDLGTFTDLESIVFNEFKESPSLLSCSESNIDQSFKLHTSILRSNCKITSQPDWGDLFISYSGSKKIDFNGLAKYIVSFRNESHFHEEVVEMIFKRLETLFNEDDLDLTVTALYTRRGGLDICPSRSSKSTTYSSQSDVSNLININQLCTKTIRQ
jgi:7-cyano-7-deazaguanine reductase